MDCILASGIASHFRHVIIGKPRNGNEALLKHPIHFFAVFTKGLAVKEQFF